MHYIRFLRAPKLSGRNRLQIHLLFTITTDLGDSFLWPQKFFELQVTGTATSELGTSSWLLSVPGKLFWEPGMRVAKPTLDLPGSFQDAIEAGARVQFCVRAAEAKHSADGASRILAVPADPPRYRDEASLRGLVMPAFVSLNPRVGGVEVCTRKIHLGESGDGLGYVEIEEEIGESIARHIWDAGVVALCAIAGITTLPEHESSQHACMKAVQDIFRMQPSIHVLELGCGVGILGAGLGAVYPRLAPGKCTILMTDLEEAQGRARGNIDRLEREASQLAEPRVRYLYENLDWENGRQGQFGPLAKSHPWDLVMLSDCTYNVDMLPALVETLSAIHANNRTLVMPGQRFPPTRVFLATKPRHETEQALFDLLLRDDWEMLHKLVLPLSVLGSQPESVELYLFEKSRSSHASQR
ncbi:Fc.00g044090.m01.CDS01 [Cosmosporella sp. VM-42]